MSFLSTFSTSVPSIFFLIWLLSSAITYGFTLTMIPVVSHENLTLVQMHATLIKISKQRAFHLTNRSLKQLLAANTNPSNSTNTITAPLKQAFSGYFYTQIGIGTPPLKANLVMDTGSDITWVQSSNCIKCFPVSPPFQNFSPDQSITYQVMPYDHPLCTPPLGRLGESPSCFYRLYYADDQSTTGEFGSDTFSFLSQNWKLEQVPRVAFGCGLINKIDLGSQGKHGNPITGILGLERSHPSSFLNQLRSITLQRFSYCLPLGSGSVEQSLLHFGHDAQISGPDVQTTPILGGPGDDYMLKVINITVNAKFVPIEQKSLVPQNDDEGLIFIIDSGTLHSFMVPTAYNILRQSMVNYFLDNYGWRPLNASARRPDGYDLCYEMRRGLEYVFPAMTLHLEGGADLELEKDNIFIDFEEENQFCMTILPSHDVLGPNFLGAFQQANHRFLFDVAASRLSFTLEKC